MDRQTLVRAWHLAVAVAPLVAIVLTTAAGLRWR
jgi:hypothetical protein